MNDKRNSVIPLLGGISIGSLVPILGFGLGLGDRLWTPTKTTADLDRRLTSIEEQVKRIPFLESKIDALLTRIRRPITSSAATAFSGGTRNSSARDRRGEVFSPHHRGSP